MRSEHPFTLESGIDVGQGITVGPGKFVKKNKPSLIDALTNTSTT